MSFSTERSTPEMSVVIVADSYATIRKTMRHIRAQGICERLEIVIVTATPDDFETDELADFLNVQIVASDVILPLSRALAAGIRQASAPIIVLAESHCYPGPGWAQSLIEAHQQPWAIVGPVISNANPNSMISWANLFMDYGRFTETTIVGITESVPGHNSAYKRDILLQYDAQLETMMDAEILLHWDMRAQGHQFFLHEGAKTYHLNITKLSSWLPERFYTGRRFASARAAPWPILRRLAYAFASPLIPWVRLPRVLGDIKRSTRRHEMLPRILPPLFAGLVAGAFGEMAGYVFGAGNAPVELAWLELHKARHVTGKDRQLLED